MDMEEQREEALTVRIHPPPGTTQEQLPALATALDAFILNACEAQPPNGPGGYIWHVEPLRIVPTPAASTSQAGASSFAVLEGRCRVGECVEDEWWAVYLLKIASKRWDLVISVTDADGQFLLIEAADKLPSWVSPENAENRVSTKRSSLFCDSGAQLPPTAHTFMVH